MDRKLDILNNELRELQLKVSELEKEIYLHEIENLSQWKIAVINAFYPNAMDLVMKWKGDDQYVKEETAKFDVETHINYNYEDCILSTSRKIFSYSRDDNYDGSINHGIFFFRKECLPTNQSEIPIIVVWRE